MNTPLVMPRRRIMVVAALAVVVLSGTAATALRSDSADASPVVVRAPVVQEQVAKDALAEGARNRLNLALFTGPSTLASGAGKATPEQLIALQTALDAARAVFTTGTAPELLAALASVEDASGAVTTAVSAWDGEQVRAAAQAQVDAAAAADRERATVQQQQDAAAAASAARTASPTPAAPEAVAVPATWTPIPEDPEVAARDANAWYLADLAGVGATGVTVSSDWATCSQVDAGPAHIQGCATSGSPTTIFMKPIDVSIARSETARGVVIHEWAHLLQYRLGYQAVAAAADAVYGVGVGVEQSADCMAIQLGARGKPGGYTDDCSGARGVLAATFLAGTVP